MPIRVVFLLWGLLSIQFSTKAQTKIYVSVMGNDQNNGTFQMPVKTIDKALSIAQQQPSSVTIQLRAGTYYLDSTIVIRSNSFKPTSLIIRNYKNEKVHISAGQKLQLQWKPYKNGIYQAKVPAGSHFEQLYINGALQVLARYPNYDPTARIFNGTSSDAISPDRIKTWKNPIGGYVHALHANEWGSQYYRITGIHSDGSAQLAGGWQNNRPGPMHKQYQFVENIFEELDAPGEWFLDKTKNVLYYYPKQNTLLTTATVEVSRLKNSIELKGNADNPLRNIHLQGISFVHNDRSFWETKEPLVRSDWTIYRGGSLLLDGTENCTIKDCHFNAIGGNAVMISNYNRKDTIADCEMTNIGASAICFVGNSNALRSPSFRYEDYIPYEKLDKTPGPLTNDYPQQCVATDNLIHDIGRIEKQATGVEIEMSSEITVSHNSIYNTSRAGINIGDGAFGGHIIEYNDVFNTVLETGDHGAFNAWGRDRYWAADRNYMDSIVAAHPELELLDAQKAIVLRNNRFRCDHGWDIDLDDGSSNYHIYNNVCLNGGLKLREGFYRIVENNILLNNSFHPHVWFKNSNDVFEHNIVMEPYFPIGINWWGKSVDDNLFPDNEALQMARNNNTDKNSIAGNPDFKNPSTADYRVKPNSPAFKIGFKNFPMQFGVRKTSLRKKALQPSIPILIHTKVSDENKNAAISFLGGKIKSVEGLGDRSAYGLPDENGVVVVTVNKESLLAESGLLEKDVIRNIDGKNVSNTQQLLGMYNSLRAFKEKVPIEIIRNQQTMKLVLQLK